MIDLDNPVIDLTAMDRCIRCGAQAVVLAAHEQWGDMLFCAHHIREHQAKLLDEDWIIVEDSAQLERLYS